MKKNNLSIFVIILLSVFSLSIKAQNGLTIIVKDKVDEGYFKKHTELTATLAGLSSEADAKTLCASIASNSKITKCEVIGNDGKGNYDVKISVSRPQEFAFYREIAMKNNIQYAVVNGEKKHLAEIK